jgi:hypothetical protein
MWSFPMNDDKLTPAELGSLGGKARAESLTKEERSEQARRAVEARWEKAGRSALRATHGSAERPLRIGALEIPCYVLENGVRVLSGRGMQAALGLGQGHGAILRDFLATPSLKPFIPKDLAMALTDPLRFVRPGRGGKVAVGFEATILADICDVILQARKAHSLTKRQLVIADQCEMLTRAFAKVGIIALVDEATGYQEVRDRLALQAFLDRFLQKEFAAWAKRFPDEFYQQIFRLRGWEWKGMKVNKPQCVASYTKNLVYSRLAPGILKELESRNPIENGRRKSAHHQWLTEEIGHPALAQHLYATIGLMRLSGDGEWNAFLKLMNRAYPRRDDLKDYPLFRDIID